MSDTTEIVKSRKPYNTGIDEFLTRTCLESTMGEVMLKCERAANAKSYAVASMIRNAVFEQDVELIKTLVTRVDGLVPAEGDREIYANILGDAIEDVLTYTSADMMKVVPEDPPIIAMAKVVVYVATQPAGSNNTRRRERNLAAQMLTERTGGRKVQPAKPLLETKYVEPDWMVGDGSAGETKEDGCTA